MTETHRRGFLRAAVLAAAPLDLAADGEPVPPEEVQAAQDVTRTLARYVVAARPADLPPTVRKEAARTLLNWIGCAVGGSRHRTVDIAIEALSPFSGRAEATVLGRSNRLDIFHAALMNGISSHIFDFDDTHLRTIIHPAGPVASAILALAEHRPVSGEDFVNALVLGAEVECRIGNAVYPAHYDVGWHITGTVGPFGAAAAAGKLLNLSEQQMIWALGLAAAQPVGLREMFGTMTKSFHPGRAAQNGLTAAFLASKNFTSSNQGIEAPRGWANVLSTARRYSEITNDLGKTYEISFNTYKPFPCGIVIHPAIDGALQLRAERGLRAEQIDRVVLNVHPLVLELTGRKAPQSGLESKFSVYHAVAVALSRGTVGEREFADEAVKDPAVLALRERVSAEVDRSIAEDQVRIAITLKDGQRLDKHVVHAVGSMANPMSDAQLEAKFRTLAEGILPADRVRRLMDMAWNIATLPDVAQVARTGAA
jgi:2-methylcitrate dehydratase PrpD